MYRPIVYVLRGAGAIYPEGHVPPSTFGSGRGKEGHRIGATKNAQR